MKDFTSNQNADGAGPTGPGVPNAQRKAWMGLMAQASASDLIALWEALDFRVPTDRAAEADTRKTTGVSARDLIADFAWLRPPEVGGVMVRGRAGATGAAFNLGEMSVTRCSLRLKDGRVGHAMVQGRDRKKAEIAALCDALLLPALAIDGVDAGQGGADQIKDPLQGENARVPDQMRDIICTGVLHPLDQARAERRRERAAKAAATKVDFFTLVRGE